MSSPSLRLLAARHALWLASSDELIQGADAVLNRGIYSYSLGELGTVSAAIMADVAPLFLAALLELDITPPSKEEAVQRVVRHYYEVIVEGADTPLAVLDRFTSESYRKADREIQKMADPLGWSELIGLYYAYDEVERLTFEGAMDPQQLSRLKEEVDRDARTSAQDWLRSQYGPGIDWSWLRWNDGTVLKIIEGIVEEQAFDRLSILHDALIDAGCDNQDILDHLREPGAHTIRCWVVDLLLDKK
jgi:hypothetical protein